MGGLSTLTSIVGHGRVALVTSKVSIPATNVDPY